jgi:Tfp pilus assembly protein PilN
MIKVNLAGTPRKSSFSKSSFSLSGPKMNADLGLQLAMILIAVGAVAGGYLWQRNLTMTLNDLNGRIAQAQAQKAHFEKVIKEDKIYETRKKEILNRIKIIEGLKRDQISPVVSLDALGQAVDHTNYVWLNNLDQNNAVFSMSGTGTSVNAIADFVSNLESTGYFHNVNLVNAQDAHGNFTFSMTCEFAPPARLPQQPPVVEAQSRGAN